ncbi:GrpB family protein [Roseofilum reptotaenium CS-1145]|nr:GrpB family protein [Roseofilum reptotaenium]MDB9519367.1 GrpB family protein [Roseofilum reptotaenium CS-1145]
MMRKVEVVPHNPAWRQMFEIESQKITKVLAENLIAIHHIGSTAIPNIYAKPIIDLLGEVKDIAKIDQYNVQMGGLGYEAMGEFGIPDRRYFPKHNSEGIRTHHLHFFAVGSEQVKRHLAFRDYLIAYPEIAQQYSNLKRKLAREFSDDIEGYMDGKDGLIKDIDRKAALWKAGEE